MDLRLHVLEELFLVGGHTEHVPHCLLILDDTTVNSYGSTTICTSMDVQWLIAVLPYLASLIPKICAGLINPHNLEPSSLVVNDLVDPICLVLEQSGSYKRTHKLVLWSGLGDLVLPIPVAESMPIQFDVELFLDLGASFGQGHVCPTSQHFRLGYVIDDRRSHLGGVAITRCLPMIHHEKASVLDIPLHLSLDLSSISADDSSDVGVSSDGLPIYTAVVTTESQLDDSPLLVIAEELSRTLLLLKRFIHPVSTIVVLSAFLWLKMHRVNFFPVFAF